MRLVRLLPARWQKFVHEALKFGIVGGVNTVINYAVFNALALTVFDNGQLKATVVATVVAAITSYLMNRHWTYRDRPKSAVRREYLLFFLFNATGLIIELGMLGIAKYGFGVTSLLAINIVKTIGLVIGTAFRFWAYRTFVFQAATPAETAVPAQHVHEHHLAAELDPVAELAEAVTELEDSQDVTDAAQQAGHSPHPKTSGAARLDRQTDPLAARFSEPADDRLDGELESELHTASRRHTR
jgi:putative flippase GtrA